MFDSTRPLDFAHRRIVVWGGVFFAPVVSGWFQLLNRVPMKNKFKGTAIRVALDQLVSAPVVLTGECW